MRIEGLLENSATAHPEKCALVFGAASYTYQEVNDKANGFAHGLAQQGIGPGHRVLIFLENHPDIVFAIFGILKAGATFSVVNHSTKAEKVAFLLGNSAASAVVTNKKLLPTVEQASLQANTSILCYQVDIDTDASDQLLSFSLHSNAQAPVRRNTGIDVDLAMLVYTSGSTGFPKGVMMTHSNVLFAANSINTYLRNTPDEVILVTLPISFDYGLYQVFLAFQLGATVVLEKNFTFPAAALKKLAEHKVTNFPLVPTMAAMLVQMDNIVPGNFPNLRCFTNTGAALPPSHIARLAELFPETLMFSMYGLTECKRCTYIEPEELASRPDSVGKAIPFTQAYVADEQGVVLPPNEIGELVIRGSHVMQGYWQNIEATGKALKPNPRQPWESVLHTGDLFRQDDAGYLYFVGRKDDMIKSRGEKVSPKEVEDVLYAIPEVTEAVLVGVPDAVLGSALKAIVVVNDKSLVDKDIIRFCRTHLEAHMVPQSVEFRDSLPKGSTGKIQRSDIQKQELANSTTNAVS